MVVPFGVCAKARTAARTRTHGWPVGNPGIINLHEQVPARDRVGRAARVPRWGETAGAPSGRPSHGPRRSDWRAQGSRPLSLWQACMTDLSTVQG